MKELLRRAKSLNSYSVRLRIKAFAPYCLFAKHNYLFASVHGKRNCVVCYCAQEQKIPFCFSHSAIALFSK